jgi:hypothetical protein
MEDQLAEEFASARRLHIPELLRQTQHRFVLEKSSVGESGQKLSIRRPLPIKHVGRVRKMAVADKVPNPDVLYQYVHTEGKFNILDPLSLHEALIDHV